MQSVLELNRMDGLALLVGSEESLPRASLVERRCRFRRCHVCWCCSYIGNGRCVNMACPRNSLGQR